MDFPNSDNKRNWKQSPRRYITLIREFKTSTLQPDSTLSMPYYERNIKHYI